MAVHASAISIGMISEPLKGGGELSMCSKKKKIARESEKIGSSGREGVTRTGKGSLDQGMSLQNLFSAIQHIEGT